ncbi:hypothetical protein ISS07_04975 [Candidatus Woesearchaeota archaeon]|nr:hypothetical protein [Candidatus Woesearchaeota archaeon]
MIGYNKDRGFTEGTRVTFLTRTNLDFPGLKEKWKSADHSWEYLDLVGLENNSNAIRSFLESTDFSEYSPHAKGLIESSVRPALTHYANNIAK